MNIDKRSVSDKKIEDPNPKEIEDEFRGDNAKLKSSIEALIKMNDDGVLFPHGIGGHARALLASAYHRLKDDIH